MPLNVLPSLLFGCVLYWLAKLNRHTFGPFLGILILHALTSVALGLTISACVPTVEIGTTLGPIVVIVLLLFGGFYINLSSLPIVANWVPYINYLKYTFEAFCVNEFKGETFTCNGSGSGCLANGNEVLSSLSFGGQTSPNASVFGLSMVFVALLVIVMCVLELSHITYMPLGYKGRNYRVNPENADAKSSNEAVAQETAQEQAANVDTNAVEV